MAQVSLFTRSAGRSNLRGLDESADQVLVSQIEGTEAARSLWADTAATSANLATGTNITAVQLGAAASTVTVPGNLTINGTTTTVNTTNLTVTDALIYANDGGADPSFAGIAWDQGAALDVITVWNPTNSRIEFGRFNTVGGTSVPAAALTTLSDVRVNDLSLAGTEIAGDSAVTVSAATGSVTLDAAAAGSVNFDVNGTTFWQVTSGGDFTAFTDDQDDIGTPSAGRPANVYVSNSAVIGDANTVTVNGTSVSASSDLTIESDQTTDSTLTIQSGDAIEISAGQNSGAGDVTVFGAGLGTFGVGSNASLSDFMLRIDNNSTVTLAAGSGADLSLGSGGTQWVIDNANGDLYTPDNVDIGEATQANSPDNIYAATSVTVGTTVTITTNAVTGSAGLTVDTAAALSLGTATATSITIGRSGVLTDFPSGSSVDFTGATVTGLALGASSLAATLAVGNTTGGNDIIFTSGDVIQGEDAAAGGNLALNGGDSSASNNAGGAVSVIGGVGNGSGAGGALTLTGGLAGATGGGGNIVMSGGAGIAGIGGAVTIFGGQSGGANQGGNVIVRAGAAANAAGATPGTLTLDGGDSSGSSGASGGNVVITGGDSGAFSQSGGTVSITGGTGLVTDNAGGAVSVTGGPAIGGDNAGGAVSVTGGSSTGTVNGADVTVAGGSATGTGVDGRVIFTSGGTTYGLTASGVSGPALTTTAQTVIEAINEVNASAATFTQTFTNNTGSAILEGEVLAPSATTAGEIVLGDASSDNNASLVVGFGPSGGIADGASGGVFSVRGQLVTARFDASLTLAEGELVFLSETAGRITNVVPTTVNTVAQQVGWITDTLSYDGTTDFLAQIFFMDGPRLVN